MRARTVALMVVVATLTASPCFGAGEPRKVFRIGYLSATSTSPMPSETFQTWLPEHGYVLGQNFELVNRFAAGDDDRLPDLAAELVRLKVDVIGAPGLATVQAVKQATTAIPVVMAVRANPVRAGLVASIARPGGGTSQG